MNLIEIVPAHSLAHRREIRRMAAYDRRSRTGVIQPDHTWHVVLMCVAIAIFCGYALARWWTCV